VVGDDGEEYSAESLIAGLSEIASHRIALRKARDNVKRGPWGRE
jgi:hypothetical protein